MLATFAQLAQRGDQVSLDLRFTVDGIIALLAGILILVVPKALNYIVAAYLIYVGIVNVFDVRF